jgi:hypothetical protein
MSIHNNKSVEIPLIWRSVSVKEEVFPWHRPLQKLANHRDLIRGPRVYRWLLRNAKKEIESVYIGQSEAFHSRIAGYRAPTKSNPNDTDVILNCAFRDIEGRGGSVELQFLEIHSFTINGQVIDMGALGNQEVRLLLESLAIMTARKDGQKLLNRLPKNAHEKAVLEVLNQIPKAKRIPLLESAIARLKGTN